MCALKYLHEMNITHTDICSHNVLVSSFSPYRVKLFDFSSSVSLSSKDQTKIIWRGRTRWQPPEVLRWRNGELTKIDYPFKVVIQNFQSFQNKTFYISRILIVLD